MRQRYEDPRLMKTVHVIALTAFAVTVASVTPASGRQENRAATTPPSGMLQTMPHGNYECALPGNAGGAAFVVVEEENFRISTASQYSSAAGAGTYILRGKNLTFTRGPKKGEQFERIGDNQLRKLEADGETGALLCTRRGS